MAATSAIALDLGSSGQRALMPFTQGSLPQYSSSSDGEVPSVPAPTYVPAGPIITGSFALD